MLLRGKTAVITGCLKGIGHEAMELFARHGANIFACALAPDEKFEAGIKALAVETSVSITPVYFDMGDPEQVKVAVKQIMAAKVQVDILLNIAGITQDALFHMTSMDSLNKVMSVNFTAQMLLTQYITKLMVRQKSGSVISVSSITAMDGNPGQFSYGASKAALVGATMTLATELGLHGIRVNAIAPGVIETDMIAAVPEEARQKLFARIPMKRPGLPGEVAGPLLFLASDLSSYITGQVIRIDGGIE